MWIFGGRLFFDRDVGNNQAHLGGVKKVDKNMQASNNISFFSTQCCMSACYLVSMVNRNTFFTKKIFQALQIKGFIGY